MTKGIGMQATLHVPPRSSQRVPARKPSRGPPPAHAWGYRHPLPEHPGSGVLSRRRLVPRLRPPTAGSVLHGPMLCSRLAQQHRRRRVAVCARGLQQSHNVSIEHRLRRTRWPFTVFEVPRAC